ncbi:hypothetical protein NLM59_07440 [Weeksellaceae bacterium KMM 9724]|uniref:hypothetical protein n=1 Tax=Profundicola chukchiensis TaxID=2961959 RepID=UPI00243D0162|nr:hypothetical protein [Profundicola chukchiensis]MDG4950754.1 hypothetical protein [Profundicola chukchiensis]
MREGFVRATYELFIKEIQTILTASYVIAVGIGMLFNYQKYSQFEINIFNYSDVFDFLIAPFSDFYILLFATTSILFVLLLIKLDLVWKQYWPKSYSKANLGHDQKPWYKTYKLVAFVLTFMLYLYLSANYYGRYTKERIVKQNDISIKLVDNEINTGKLIGKTKDVIFLVKGKNVLVIPISSLVKEIRIK